MIKQTTGTEKFHHPLNRPDAITKAGRKRNRRNIQGDIKII
jgi:hypothetical protein